MEKNCRFELFVSENYSKLDVKNQPVEFIKKLNSTISYNGIRNGFKVAGGYLHHDVIETYIDVKNLSKKLQPIALNIYKKIEKNTITLL